MNLGRVSFRVGRILGHMGKISQVFVVYLFFQKVNEQYGVSWWFVLVFIPLVYLIHRIDKKWIYPEESRLAWTENPEVKKLMKG